jgi:hypothetical protein
VSLIALLASRCHVPPWVVEVALAILLVFGFALYERHQGAQRCVVADKAAVAKDEQKAASDYAKGVTTVFQEASTYDAAIHVPVDHPLHVSLCSPRSGPAAQDPAPAQERDAAAPVRAESAQQPVQRDIGPELLTIGRDADAQVIALQSYIRDVCPVR